MAGVRDPTFRRAKYKAKNNADSIRQRFADQKENMETQIDAAFPSLATMENSVKEILEADGITTIMIPFYLNVGRECYRIHNRFTGCTEDNEQAVVKLKWGATGRGLVDAEIDKIIALFA